MARLGEREEKIVEKWRSIEKVGKGMGRWRRVERGKGEEGKRVRRESETMALSCLCQPETPEATGVSARAPELIVAITRLTLPLPSRIFQIFSRVSQAFLSFFPVSLWSLVFIPLRPGVPHIGYSKSCYCWNLISFVIVPFLLLIPDTADNYWTLTI